MSIRVNVASLLTLSMKSFFVVFHAEHIFLKTAENFAVRMDCGTFYLRKRRKVRAFSVADGESSDDLMDDSNTGYMGVKMGGSSRHFPGFKNLTVSHQKFGKKGLSY